MSLSKHQYTGLPVSKRYINTGQVEYMHLAVSGPAPQQWGWLLHSRIALREMRDPLERRQPRGLPAAFAVVT